MLPESWKPLGERQITDQPANGMTDADRTRSRNQSPWTRYSGAVRARQNAIESNALGFDGVQNAV
jgi:hypothetical protein